jgi:tRNA A37 threonylcarbamoyladenosine synthetase subunit TsaC/SUA5/YrdC
MTNSTEIKWLRGLERGQVCRFPDGAVYGLGADATRDGGGEAGAAKGQFQSLISMSCGRGGFTLGEFSAEAKNWSGFWPGPLTVVVPRAVRCPVSLLASAGLSSIALRVPNHPLALELLRAVDRPVVAPSANLSGRVSPTTAAHVKRGLGKKVAVILDGGPCSVGVESTVVSFMGERATLLRPGGLSRVPSKGSAMRLRSKRIRRSPIRRGRWKAITRPMLSCASKPQRHTRAKAIWALAPMTMAPIRFRRGAMWWKLPPTSSACCTSWMAWA